jgi:CxxC motif-containing protein
LKIDEENDYKVTGNGCERGAVYGHKELTNPTRVLTTTVKIEGAAIARLPVKTDGDIPKQELFRAMEEINRITVNAPVKRGDIVLNKLLGLPVNVIATKTIESV